MVDYVERFVGKPKKNKFIAAFIVLFLLVIAIGNFLQSGNVIVQSGTDILNLINRQSDESDIPMTTHTPTISNMSFAIPDLEVRFVNKGAYDIFIDERAEFFLTLPKTPLSDVLVASGRIKLYKIADNNSTNQTELVVPEAGELVVHAHIINPSQYRALIERGDANMCLVISQSDGNMINRQGIPFDMATLTDSYIVLETR
jgi:hypothetical protein